MTRTGFVIALLFYAGINAYLFTRAWQAIPPDLAVQSVFTILFVISSISFFIGFGLGNRLPLALTSLFENIGAFWMIGLLYFIPAAMLADLIHVANRLLDFYPDWVSASYPSVKLVYLLSVTGLFILFCLAGYWRFTRPAVRKIKLEIPKGAGKGGSMVLVAASDIHLGNIIRKRRLGKYVELINSQRADLVLLVGDLLDHSVRPVEMQRMDEELRNLTSRLGVYGVFGNHEYYGDHRKAEDFYTRSDIRLLRDAVATIDNRLVLIGREDVSRSPRQPLGEIVAGINGELPRILLDHNPSRLDDALKNNIDLQISGHTHNGQIFPLNLLVRRLFKLSYGYRKEGKTHYYVSSGLGLWAAPVRIGTRSEIVRVELSLV